MTKADLVALMAKSAGCSKASAERAMNVFYEAVFEALHKQQRVTLSGFGTFIVVRRAARTGRDPRTGKEIKIPTVRVPRFRPSRSLRGEIR